MLAKVHRLLSQFFKKSRTINNEPLNKVSLLVIILIDIFIFINVFSGLANISRWPINASQAYPCYAEWKNYRTQTNKDKDYEIVRISFPYETISQLSFRKTYQQSEQDHLGKVSGTCLKYADAKDRINNSENRQTIKTIDRNQEKIKMLEEASRTIRTQYNSTLLEKIGNQPREQSINLVGAEKAKQALDKNNQNRVLLDQEISILKKELISKPESLAFIDFLKDGVKFKEVNQGYQSASFWYPSIQLAFQALFLLPLIFAALLTYNFSQRKRYGLISLMSWHLLVIFSIPFILKIFEFFQVGVIYKFIFDIVSRFLGRLVFLVSYVYILLIPLIGFGLIKVFQNVILNVKAQSASRVQKSCCIKCAKKIRSQDPYCPHCGYYQYFECQNCHQLTYSHLPYCKQCGHSQETSRS